MTVTLPTPGTLLRMSLFSLYSSQLSISVRSCLSSLAISFCRVFRMAWMELWTLFGMICKRFFSIVCILTSWLRRDSKSLIFMIISGFNVDSSGWIISPYRAIRRASSLSVLANCPIAPANFLMCTGLATTNGKPALAQAQTNACSSRPVASTTIRSGRCLPRVLTASRMPWVSLDTVKWMSAGRMWMSSWNLPTSTPTLVSDDLFGVLIV